MGRDLAERLLDFGYTDLFQRLDTQALDSIWSEADAPRSLERLAADAGAPLQARFLAAEALLTRRSGDRLDERIKREIAAVYRAALVDHLPGAANSWSDPSGALGLSGENAVKLGPIAVQTLSELLEDERSVIYEGSREAVEAASYNFRIKDLAALLISRITGDPFPDSKDPKTRDAAIAALKRRLS